MELFVARQPIFDKSQNVFGYELLYRSQQANAYDGLDGDRATLDVIHNTFLLIGSHNLTGGKKAFINFTRNLLTNKTAHNLPNQVLVIEILEDVELDDVLVKECRELRKAGYSLALDDVVAGKEFGSLLDVVDFVKVDFKLTSIEERKEIADAYAGRGIKLLAEKTETVDEFDEAKRMGYSYFQGYFFSKPVIVARNDIPTTKIAYLNVLQEIHQEELDIAALEKSVKCDASLSYKLLKYINSAYFGQQKQIESIRHALSLLGEREVRKWLSLVVMTIIAQDKTAELLANALIKAKFCELMSQEVGRREKESSSFLVGMFANLDAFIGRPLDEIVDDMPLSQDVKAALKGERNIYRDLLDIALCYETGDWDTLLKYIAAFDIDQSKIPQLYVDSVMWAETMLQNN
ncbi:MAG TPA: HDOD domain-containing protein [Thermodesulfobacteriota bacterium]|nr:HDOD domain-containing protein [Deltaproteobacteria bacterium]HNR13436.1 HDOD domain-containing protein [Thermodesulfobacteriota bacterium]HOC39093.1 HDOD domain-containing protein [Thermodesulfobacteriota bacterium]HQO78451.1 HDOD domain-containing protein [Thermodesulfobacteriota bacterium]